MSGEALGTLAAEELATLLIPVNGKQLVLPNVTVAEIIPYKDPVLEEDVPSWFLGRFEWRNVMIPLVSFDILNDEPFVGQSSDRRIAVLNSIVEDDRMSFCGIVTEGVPRLMRVTPAEVSSDDEASPGPAELSQVLVSGEQAVIPDIDFIQQETLKLL